MSRKEIGSGERTLGGHLQREAKKTECAEGKGSLYGILMRKGLGGREARYATVRGWSAVGRGCGGYVRWSRDSGDAVA